MKLNLLVRCQVAPKSAVAATRSPKTGPVMFSPVKHVGASAGITHLGRKIPARQVVRLQAQLLGRSIGTGPAVAEVVEISIANGIDNASCEEGTGARLTRSGVQHNAYVHESSARKCKELILIGGPGVSLVIAPDLVIADVGFRQDSEIDTETIVVLRCLIVLKQ